MYHILIVEDDSALNSGIMLGLKSQDHKFFSCFNLAEAKEVWRKEKIDLIILDINLPDGSGYDFLKMVREESDVPILMVTANDLEIDEVKGLSLGADDYITKPFSLAVLRARIDALKRRMERDRQKFRERYEIDEFVFDYGALSFSFQSEELVFSRNEQKLLRLFLENQGQVLTRELLVDRLWTDGAEYVEENALSVTVNRLRRKLAMGKKDTEYIQTVYGLGYMWKKKERDKKEV